MPYKPLRNILRMTPYCELVQGNATNVHRSHACGGRDEGTRLREQLDDLAQ